MPLSAEMCRNPSQCLGENAPPELSPGLVMVEAVGSRVLLLLPRQPGPVSGSLGTVSVENLEGANL